MAKRKPAAAKRGSKSSPRKAKNTEVEVVEEAESGGGWETGVAVLTGLILVAACLVVDYGLGKYDAGVFF